MSKRRTARDLTQEDFKDLMWILLTYIGSVTFFLAVGLGIAYLLKLVEWLMPS